jgi:SAM-dependent methyltransferase
METEAEAPRYTLAAKGREAAESARLEMLQQLFDGVTAERLACIQPGWRALEVAAGGGSVAKLISDRIGPDGRIVATDIDIGPSAHVSLPNGAFLTHNMLTDPLDPLGGPSSFDFVHARFFVQHIYPHEQAVISRMAELLKPGGWLMIEDLDAATMAAGDPDHPLSEAFDQATAGARGDKNADTVVAVAPGRALPSRFHKAGLVNLRHDGRIYVENGGSLMARFFVESLKVSRPQFDEKGFGPVIDLNIQTLSDPTFWFQSGAFHCAWGQKAVL